MAYNKNNNRNNGNGNGYNNNGYNNNANQQQPTKKHSGCKRYSWTPTKGDNKGIVMVGTLGWKYRKGLGLTKYKANMTSKSKQGENGWAGSIAVEIIAANGQKSFYWGTMHVPTGKVVINDLGEVMNPKGGKGGYVGSFSNN